MRWRSTTWRGRADGARLPSRGRAVSRAGGGGGAARHPWRGARRRRLLLQDARARKRVATDWGVGEQRSGSCGSYTHGCLGLDSARSHGLWQSSEGAPGTRDTHPKVARRPGARAWNFPIGVAAAALSRGGIARARVHHLRGSWLSLGREGGGCVRGPTA